MIKMYCDGSCLRPNGSGGWAFYYVLNGVIIKDAGGLYPTTNNRTEIIAAIMGLKSMYDHGLGGKKILVVSDSQYVIKGSSQWLKKWKRAKWHTSSGTAVANKDLWIELEDWFLKFKPQWRWVRGHNGHLQNTIVDKLSREAAKAARSSFEGA